MIIGLDFDGTLVTHCYPSISLDIGAFDWLKDAQRAGARFVLFTMRSGMYLDDAVQFIKRNGIELFGVNVNPEQKEWTTSPKAYCHLYIDDAALGAPLMVSGTNPRPHIDWQRAGPLMLAMLDAWMRSKYE